MDNIVISSDSHVFEPPDLWTTRMDPKFRDRAPKIVRDEDGDWWYCEGQRGQSMSQGAQFGIRFDNPEKLTLTDRFENVPKGGYIAAEHIKDLDKDGVYADVLYPTASLLFYMGVRDSQLLSSIFRTYNDWVAEFCSEYPNRLKGIAMINLDNVQEGIAEIERTRKMGLVGAMISVYPPEDRSYYMSEYEPLWAAAQDLDVPLSFHVATGRSSTAGAAVGDAGLASTPAFRANLDFWVRMSLAHVIYSGAFERYPKLMVGTVEHELAWIPHFLYQIDYVYTQRPQRSGWFTFKNGALPSNFFATNVFCSFQEDDMGIRDRDVIGVDTLMWGSDYPHPEGTFPKSREVLDRILEGVPSDVKAKIVGGNVARLYHIG